MPFDEDDINHSTDAIGKKGLKITNVKSSVKDVPTKSSRDEFLKKANEANRQLNAYSERVSTLAVQFKKILEDKTLSINKTPFAKEAERELLGNLVQLAIDMNSDEHEVESMGSVALITMLLRSILIQRDKINTLEYVIEKKLKDTTSAPIDTTKLGV